jgi:hypothetical protein
LADNTRSNVSHSGFAFDCFNMCSRWMESIKNNLKQWIQRHKHTTK